MIFFVSGMEERHTNNSRGICGWASAGGTVIDTLVKNTGVAGLKLLFQGYTGASSTSTGNKCWWSFASRQWGRTNGTYMYIFRIFTDVSTPTTKKRYIGWYFNTADSKYYLALFDDTAGHRIVTSTNGNATIQYYEFKLEFDNDEWTLWSNLSGSWQSEFTYSDSTTGPRTFRVSFNFSTDATKILSNGEIRLDDVVAWDDQGNNWNSRIAAIDDFPRISVAHVLASPESNAGQAVKLDEIPPDGVDKATVTASGYWATPPALDGSVTDTIQAVFCTHIWVGFEPATWRDFNMREDGTLHADSNEGGRGIMRGTSGGSPVWRQAAGYWPWTFDEVEWDATSFAAVEYGAAIIDTESDQLTVQVISFGSAHEWSPSVTGADEEWAGAQQPTSEPLLVPDKIVAY